MELKNKTCLRATLAMAITASSLASFSDEVPAFTIGDREVVVTKEQRNALGLKWFIDGNGGVLTSGDEVQLYGANGKDPARVTGTQDRLFQKVDPVSISTGNKGFQYLAGGPLFRDPKSWRLLLFYHAEIHRGTAKNFYSVLGLSIQTDEQGLRFKDLGPIFTANIQNDQAKWSIEVGGSPYIIKDGYFYVYALDTMQEGLSHQSHLTVARARVDDVVNASLAGNSTEWMKYYRGTFSEPALGGKSSSLEIGNPRIRWMDICYNEKLNKFVMVVAANTSRQHVELFITCSDDGIHWAERKQLSNDNGEAFYPSFVGFMADPRHTGQEFYIYYTFSAKGGWERWDDAVIARRKITLVRVLAQQAAPEGRLAQRNN